MTEWKALPGGVLAYGDTGFEIREQPGEESCYHALALVDPQGRKITTSYYAGLAYLKREAMNHARAAEEFRGGPPVPPNPPSDGGGGPGGPDKTPSPTPSPTLEKAR